MTTHVGSGSHLRLQMIPVLYLGIKLPGIKRELHLSQEAVVSKAVVVPHRHLQGSGFQLRVADNILKNTEENSFQFRHFNSVFACLLVFCHGPSGSR